MRLEQACWALAPNKCGQLAWAPFGGRHPALTVMSWALPSVSAREVRTCRLDPIIGGSHLALAVMSWASSSVFVDTG